MLLDSLTSMGTALSLTSYTECPYGREYKAPPARELSMNPTRNIFHGVYKSATKWFMQCLITGNSMVGLHQIFVFVHAIRNIKVNETYKFVINIFTKHFHPYEHAYLNVRGTETPSEA
jgi:hypothetical protein